MVNHVSYKPRNDFSNQLAYANLKVKIGLNRTNICMVAAD